MDNGGIVESSAQKFVSQDETQFMKSDERSPDDAKTTVRCSIRSWKINKESRIMERFSPRRSQVEERNEVEFEGGVLQGGGRTPKPHAGKEPQETPHTPGP